ncbi:MAG: glycosyltransferase family 4 protein [Anaerolineae bacterium]|nr:glycosyltransferase family 4 protein [Anaerolineae bacterium]
MMGPRRILYIDLAPAVGGSVISLYLLVKGLDRARYEPRVVLCSSNGYVQRFRDLGVAVMTVETQTAGQLSSEASEGEGGGIWLALRRSRFAQMLRKSTFGRSLVHVVGFFVRTWPALQQTARRLAELIESTQPDLVHLNDVVCVSRAGILAARRQGVPAICHLRAMAWRNAFDRRLSRWLRGYICISEAVQRHQRQLGGRTGPSWVVYNGLDLDDYETLVDRATARRELDLALGPEDMVVGCVGRLVEWKGQHIFLQALGQLAPRYPRLRGLVVGAPESHSGAYAQELRDLADRPGLRDRVIFTGFRQDVPRLLSGMDVMVHASTAPEPFGRVLIEAMAAGTTVIGTRAGAVPEIIEDRVTGLLVAPGDVDAMAEAIAYALDHPDERGRWQRAARQVVGDQFDVRRYVRGVEQVYEALLN